MKVPRAPELARPRDLPALFRDSLTVYARHAGTFLLLAASIVVPVHLIVQGVGLEKLSAPYEPSPSVAEALLPAAVSYLVTAPLITATCIYALASVAGGERPSAWAAIAEGVDAFAPIFLAIVMAAVGIALGLIALIVPGVYLAVRWFFIPQAVVLDGRRGREALRRSAQAVDGSWWRTLGVLLLANLAAAVPGVLLAGPFTALAREADRELWALVGTMATDTVTTPFVALLSTLLWFDLLARKAAT